MEASLSIKKTTKAAFLKAKNSITIIKQLEICIFYLLICNGLPTFAPQITFSSSAPDYWTFKKNKISLPVSKEFG